MKQAEKWSSDSETLGNGNHQSYWSSAHIPMGGAGHLLTPRVGKQRCRLTSQIESWEQRSREGIEGRAMLA